VEKESRKDLQIEPSGPRGSDDKRHPRFKMGLNLTGAQTKKSRTKDQKDSQNEGTRRKGLRNYRLGGGGKETNGHVTLYVRVGRVAGVEVMGNAHRGGDLAGARERREDLFKKKSHIGGLPWFSITGAGSENSCP